MQLQMNLPMTTNTGQCLLGKHLKPLVMKDSGKSVKVILHHVLGQG
jgi:hypothetical protein